MSTPVKVSTYNIIGVAYLSAGYVDVPLSAIPVDFFASGSVSGIATDQKHLWFLSGTSYQDTIYNPPAPSATADFSWEIQNTVSADFSWEIQNTVSADFSWEIQTVAPVSADFSWEIQNVSASADFSWEIQNVL